MAVRPVRVGVGPGGGPGEGRVGAVRVGVVPGGGLKLPQCRAQQVHRPVGLAKLGFGLAKAKVGIALPPSPINQPALFLHLCPFIPLNPLT